jgi:hypothetical protein
MANQVKKWRDHMMRYSLIPIRVRALVQMFGYHDVCVPDSRLNSLALQDDFKSKNDCKANSSLPSPCIALVLCN